MCDGVCDGVCVMVCVMVCVCVCVCLLYLLLTSYLYDQPCASTRGIQAGRLGAQWKERRNVEGLEKQLKKKE